MLNYFWLFFFFLSIEVKLEGHGSKNKTLKRKTEEYLIACRACLVMEGEIAIENTHIYKLFTHSESVYCLLGIKSLTLRSTQLTALGVLVGIITW